MVVMLAGGMIGGVVLGLVFRIGVFNFLWWVVLALSILSSCPGSPRTVS